MDKWKSNLWSDVKMAFGASIIAIAGMRFVSHLTYNWWEWIAVYCISVIVCLVLYGIYRLIGRLIKYTWR